MSVTVPVVLNMTGRWGHLAFLLPEQNPAHHTACKESHLLLCESLFLPHRISISLRVLWGRSVRRGKYKSLLPSESPILIHRATELSICLSAWCKWKGIMPPLLMKNSGQTFFKHLEHRFCSEASTWPQKFIYFLGSG